jgi:hypothetical protein
MGPMFIVNLHPKHQMFNVPQLIISLNLIVPIPHLFYHVPPQTYHPPHPSHKPQIANHPLITPPILTNHTPPTSSPDP